jgi:hypothetical protein
MENSLIRIVLLLDKGADIIEFVSKPDDIDFMWKHDDGLCETATRITPAAQGAGAYFDYYPGGWQEILPGGGPMNYCGAEVGLHGELSLRPWEFSVEKDSSEKISVTLSAKTVRFPFAVIKRVTIEEGKPRVYFDEELRNEGAQSLEYMWAQHPCFGSPFLDPGCVINIPAKKMFTSPGFHTAGMIFPAGFATEWPFSGGEKIVNVQAEHSGITGLYHFSELIEGKCSIFNKNKKIGFSLEWDKNVFPCVTSWQDYNGTIDYPWYGRAYQVTLEFWNTPTDNFATAKKIGPLPVLSGGGKICTSYSATLIKDLP